MADSIEELYYQQKKCLVCRDPFDFNNDDIKLMRCIGCNTIYHNGCWKAILIKGCLVCGGHSASNYDTSLIINEAWEIKSPCDNVSNAANGFSPDFIINEIRED